MRDLIEAIQIFLKYVDGDVEHPTWCAHDELNFAIDIKVSDEDRSRLDKLGFFEDKNEGGWKSFRYGSC